MENLVLLRMLVELHTMCTVPTEFFQKTKTTHRAELGQIHFTAAISTEQHRTVPSATPQNVAVSITKRYLTSLAIVRSNASLIWSARIFSTSHPML